MQQFTVQIRRLSCLVATVMSGLFLLGTGHLAHAASKKEKGVGFGSYKLSTYKKAPKAEEEKLYKLGRKANGIDKKASAEAHKAIKKLTPNDIPAMFGALSRSSSFAKLFYPVFIKFGDKGLLAVDLLLTKNAPVAKYESFSRRRRYLKGIGAVCAKFGAKALPALRASLVAKDRFQKRAAAWGLALMGQAAWPTLREGLTSPRALERIGVLHVFERLKSKEVAPFLQLLLKSLATAHKVKDLSYLKYELQRLFVEVLPNAGEKAPEAILALLSKKKASSIEKHVAPKALQKLGPKAKSVAGKLIPLLKSSSAKQQLLATTLLATMKIKLPQAHASLQKLVASGKEPVRHNAARALVVCGDITANSATLIAKALEDALAKLDKESSKYNKIVTSYLETLAMLKGNAEAAGNVLIKVLKHPKATKGHVLKTAKVLTPFAKNIQAAFEPLQAAMKKHSFASYQLSTLQDCMLAFGKKGFLAMVPNMKKEIRKVSRYGVYGLLGKLKKIGAPAAVFIEDLFYNASKQSRKSNKISIAKALSWMALHRPKAFIKGAKNKDPKVHEIALVTIAQNDKLVKQHRALLQQLLQKASKNIKAYTDDVLSETMDKLRKRDGKLLIGLENDIKPFLKKGSFMSKIYAKYVLQSIKKAKGKK